MSKVTDDTKPLRDAIELMDGYSQAGFGEIETIARLALAYMETPAAHRDMEHIASALDVIASKAADIMNCINCTAEEVGCNYQDQAWRRRADASRAAKGAQS